MQHNWIFQLSKSLAPEQRKPLQASLANLVAEWKSHGAMVPGAYDIKYDQFIVIQAEPGSTSGCSIDSMNHGVDAILAEFGLETLPHNFIFYRNAEGQLEKVDFRELKAAVAAGKMGPDTTVYDSSLGQTDDITRWEVKMADSWMARFLPAKQDA